MARADNAFSEKKTDVVGFACGPYLRDERELGLIGRKARLKSPRVGYSVSS